MNQYAPSHKELADKAGLSVADAAEKKARLAVCKIAHGQSQGHAECGVLVYDQKVDDHELSKHCIITINEVVNSIENKIFEKGEYKVTFGHKNKQFYLRNVTKVVRNASGLVLIFINSSCKELNHKEKKCSILSESPLSIAAPDHPSNSPLFCFIENQRYIIVASTGENGKECVYVLEPDSKTATSVSDSPKQIPHGTVILQYDADAKNVMAVGIFKVMDKNHMKITPIWFKSSLNDLLAPTPPSTTDGGQTPSTSDTATPTTDSGKTSSTSDTATPTTDSGQTSSTSDNPTPTTDSGQTSSTSATATPTTDDGQTPSSSATATPTTDGGQTPSTSDTATSATDGGQTSSTSDTATLTTDGGQASSISVVTTTSGPQSATVQPGDTSANTTDNQGLPAAGSDHTTEDELGLHMNIENVPNAQVVLNAIASRYLETVRPSNREEFNEFKQYLTEVLKILIVDIRRGSLIITVKCSLLQILEELWEDYCSGHLNEMGQKCLMTEEILREFGLKKAKLTTTIPKREYRTCQQYFMELLGVSEQFISKAVTENTLLLERLSKYLDRESGVIKCWKHLAYVLNVPAEETRKFGMFTEHSPTEDMFFHLADVNPDLTVEVLKTKLKNIHRNDVIALLNEGGYSNEKNVGELMDKDRKFSAILSANLDKRSINDWKKLATEFEIPHRKTDQFGLGGPGPTALLFLHVSTTKGLQDLTMGQLVYHFDALEMKQLVKVVKKHTYEVSDLVSKVVVEGSELLAEIGEHLNHEVRVRKNWRDLAYKLGISPEDSKTFDTSTETSKSPTRMMFEWLQSSKPKLTVRDLVNGLENIDRYDVVDVVRKDVAIALEKTKKQKDDSTQGYCTAH